VPVSQPHPSSSDTQLCAGKRLGKYVFKETDATVQSYVEVLDDLMQQFRDQIARDVSIYHKGKGQFTEPSLTLNDLWPS
jgi:hypothetical protein